MKILVVDDDKEIVQLLEIYIRNEGYEPISAYDGKEALTKLNTNPDIGLIILDLMMPEIDGMDVIKRVRKESYTYLPVTLIVFSQQMTFLSGYGNKKVSYQPKQSWFT